MKVLNSDEEKTLEISKLKEEIKELKLLVKNNNDEISKLKEEILINKNDEISKLIENKLKDFKIKLGDKYYDIFTNELDLTTINYNYINPQYMNYLFSKFININTIIVNIHSIGYISNYDLFPNLINNNIITFNIIGNSKEDDFLNMRQLLSLIYAKKYIKDTDYYINVYNFTIHEYLKRMDSSPKSLEETSVENYKNENKIYINFKNCIFVRNDNCGGHIKITEHNFSTLFNDIKFLKFNFD